MDPMAAFEKRVIMLTVCVSKKMVEPNEENTT